MVDKMRLALIASILLLVPLAASTEDDDRGEPTEPYFKMLYHDGYVITESSDTRSIDYRYSERGWDKNIFLLETSHDPHEDYSMFTESMELKYDLAKRSPGFAIESYPTTVKFSLKNNHFCERNASVELQYLIHRCSNRILLRHLTEEEKAQIEQYKKEQQESKKVFDVVYDRTRVISKANNLNKFQYADKVNKYSKNHEFFFFTMHDSRKEYPRIDFNGKTAYKAILVEGLPLDSENECGKTGLDDLIMTHCHGNIRARPFTPN